MVDRKTNILFVALSLERGGTERHLATMMPLLQDKGWTVALYCIATRGEMADQVERSGVEVIGPPIKGSAWFTGPMKLVRLSLTAIKLFWIMAYRQPHIVHFFLPGPYLLGGPLALLTARPIRIMSRRNLNHYLAKRPIAKRFELALHGRMTAILANSASIVKELIETECCAPNNVGLIRNGVDIGSSAVDASQTRARLSVGANAFVAIIVANLNQYKGHADLICALGAIKARMPPNWTVLFAGSDYGAGRAIQDLITEHGLAEHIQLLGSRRDVPDLLRASNVGLLCSHEEGFSNAVLEGMAAGLPMIVTDVGGNFEAVRDGVDGLVVPSRNPAELGAAILTLALDPDLRRRMGQAAAERAKTEFSIEACLQSYDRFYRGLLDGQSAAKLAPHGFEISPLDESKLA